MIVDASVALAWAMPDERSEISLRLLILAQAQTIVVPGHFRAELANGLKMGEPQRISHTEITQFVQLLESLDISVDHLGADDVFNRVLPLAREHRLTVYDALYLELAMRTGLPMATFDAALAAAAKQAGVDILC